jgi:hypothetical protein
MKKILITTTLIATMFCGSMFARDYNGYVTTQMGSGYTKGDALASALSNLPYGAVVKRVNFNGYSIRQCVPGAGYVQTYGSFKCKVTYSGK